MTVTELSESKPTEATANPLPSEELRKPVTLRRRSAAPWLLTGTLVVAFLFGSLTAWSAFAPLAQGAVAPGVISVEGKRQSIQHLEGGIISAIHVSAGDRVSRGDPLITLDPTRTQAELDIIRTQYRSARAREARLIAQRDGADRVAFPDELLLIAEENSAVAEAIQSEQATFESQAATIAGRRNILEERIRRSEEEIAGTRAQIDALTEQLRLTREEEGDALELMEKGLMRRPRLLALQRQASDLEGQIAGARARIAQITNEIGETRLQIIDLDNERRQTVVQDLRAVQDEIARLTDQLTAVNDVAERLVVRAPAAGIIVDPAFNTVGGVVGGGERLMDLLPLDAGLVVTVQVSPKNIDVIYPGMEAKVMLSAFNIRDLPQLIGVVTSVSADRLTDERTGQPYFDASVEIPQEELDLLGDRELYPGMPAEVTFVAGHRSIIAYLTEPFTESIRRGFVGE